MRRTPLTYATTSDVAIRLGRELTAEETSLVEIRLDDVERRILRRIPDLDDQITAGDIDEADVVQVEADAVLRLVRNPDGYLSETDGNYTYMFRQDLANGKLEILAAEWETLGVVTGSVAQLVPTFSDAPAPPVRPFMLGG
jgi:hypothetical protein